MSFFETLIIGHKPEFLFEASHINEDPVFIAGCTQSTVGVIVHGFFVIAVINISTLITKEKRSKKENYYCDVRIWIAWKQI